MPAHGLGLAVVSVNPKVKDEDVVQSVGCVGPLVRSELNFRGILAAGVGQIDTG